MAGSGNHYLLLSFNFSGSDNVKSYKDHGYSLTLNLLTSQLTSYFNCTLLMSFPAMEIFNSMERKCKVKY